MSGIFELSDKKELLSHSYTYLIGVVYNANMGLDGMSVKDSIIYLQKLKREDTASNDVEYIESVLEKNKKLIGNIKNKKIAMDAGWEQK